MTDEDNTPKDDNQGTIEPKSKLGISSITSSEMPEVKENAIAAVNAQKEGEIREAVAVDGFDPEIHVTDATGKPLYNKNGTLKKKRGRKKGGTTNSQLKLEKPKTPEEVAAEAGSLEAAIVISGLLEQTQVKLISDEFIYEEIERSANIDAWKRTLDHYGGLNLTPPQALILSHLQIIIARAASPENKKTQEKFVLVGAWFKNKVSNFKFKKKAKKDGTHADSGKDAKREDNSGEKDSGGS